MGCQVDATLAYNRRQLGKGQYTFVATEPQALHSRGHGQPEEVPVRCEPEEKPIWEQIAADEGISLSAYIVRLVRADVMARHKAATALAPQPEPPKASEPAATYAAPAPVRKRRPRKKARRAKRR
jgi:hypothetical protein